MRHSALAVLFSASIQKVGYVRLTGQSEDCKDLLHMLFFCTRIYFLSELTRSGVEYWHMNIIQTFFVSRAFVAAVATATTLSLVEILTSIRDLNYILNRLADSRLSSQSI